MPNNAGIPPHIRALAKPALPADLQCLMAVAMETWRMLKTVSLMECGGSEGRRLRALAAALQRQKDALNQAGLEWQEYDESPYDPGMNLQVLHYETRDAGLDKAIILETVRPAFKFKGQIIAPAQVIVAGPKHQGE